MSKQQKIRKNGNALVFETPGKTYFVPDIAMTRRAANQGYDLGFEDGVQQALAYMHRRDDFWQWWGKVELVTRDIFRSAELGSYAPAQIVKAAFEGRTAEFTGALNETLNAAKNLNIDLVGNWPEIGQRAEQISDALRRIQGAVINKDSDTDESPVLRDALDDLRELASTAKGFEIPLHIRAQIDRGGAPQKECLDWIGREGVKLKAEGNTPALIAVILSQRCKIESQDTTDPEHELKAESYRWLVYDRFGREKKARKKAQDVSRAILRYEDLSN